jgi:iron complex outermembrane recepter protein
MYLCSYLKGFFAYNKDAEKIQTCQSEIELALIWKTIIVISLVLLIIPTNVSANDDIPADLTELSIEDLMDIEVTSVSKKAEKLSDAAAAIFVLTGKEIRKSGARTIPDALRMVPGLHVANIDGSTWAISARGFNGSFSNKLLVLIDGRTVYSSLFSGVWWDIQDVLMEDIDRIEVIRGPGATLWGANAVNGVINITTTQASKSQEAIMTVGSGTYEQGNGALQYNGPVGNNGSFRVYGKYFDRNEFDASSGIDTKDDWWMGRGGFRYDGALSDLNNITIQGDVYNAKAGANYMVPDLNAPYTKFLQEQTNIAGGNILARFTRQNQSGSQHTMQIYFDYTTRNDTWVDLNCKTYDFDYQHSFGVSSQLDVMWGGGYRVNQDRITNGLYVSMSPSERTYGLGNVFTQLDYAIIPDRLELTLGTKVEYNEFTNFEIQPNGRILWHLAKNHTFWASVSRAVRTPSRIDQEGNVFMVAVPPLSLSNPSPIPAKVVLRGIGESRSESLIAYEAGYRSIFSNRITIDVAGFYNRYNDLMSVAIREPEFDENYPAYVILPVDFINARKAETYGFEFAGGWKPSDRVEFKLTYSRQWSYAGFGGEGVSFGSLNSFESPGPSNQFSLYATTEVGSNINLTSQIRYVDEIERQGISSYVTGDLRFGWQVLPQLELSVTGQDLFEKSHLEFISEMGRISTGVERRFHADIKLSL